jgi:hypothetical protein
VITASEATAISGIGGAIVGGALTWMGAAWSQRGQSRTRRTEIRTDAYGAMIGALDELLRLWDAPETMGLPGDQKVGAATGVAVGRIQQTYGVVRLVGSDVARRNAQAACAAAWDLSNLLNTPGEVFGKLGSTFDTFKDAAREFGKGAEVEVAP